MEGAAGGVPAEGWLVVRVHVPELNVHKSLQFPKDQLVWDVKQQCLAALPKELKESFNYGLFCPPANGKAGKFLDEERRLGDYPFNGSVGYLELKYKRRVYKMLKLDEKQLKAVHTKTNLRRFIDYVNHGQVEKITKMCSKGLDPNFHCQDTGETPLTIATAQKKPSKVLISLVNGGALLDYRTRDGSTAMHKAVEKNSLEAVRTLLELGASPNYKDGKGLTPLYLSVTNKTDPLLCECLLHDHATIGAKDLQGWQEVHQACRNGLIQHLDHLLFYGADMNGKNASGNTPLHVCAVNGQDSCTRQLLFRGCDREALNFANQTPYQVAVIAGNMELAEVIKNYKPDEVVPFRGPPRYNPKRRSGLAIGLGLNWGWAGDRSSMASSLPIVPSELDTLSLLRRPVPSPCPSERPFSSASSSVSDGSHPSHEDNASIVTDKSLGDTSDIISDSSGVGTTTSDTTTSSLAMPGSTVVCLENYDSGMPGHLRISQGDIIEVTGATDCGLLEGIVRGAGRGSSAGIFPPHCVQEVRLRQGASLNIPTASMNANNTFSLILNRRDYSKSYSATAPRLKKTTNNMEYRTVLLHKASRGFGFVLRGAKASSALMDLTPSERCPGLQYLDDVDPGGVADLAGLKKGDYLIAINDEDVSAASHEHVIDLIRKSGSHVSMTVVSVNQFGSGGNGSGILPASKSVVQLSHVQSSVCSGARQYATLPRKAGGASSGRSPAPAPPRRDPRTTLSVGRARAKSMVAGLENGGEKDDCTDQLGNTKSSSAESIQQQGITSGGGSGTCTPVAPRTASIRSRPPTSRITATELEEMFQRQQKQAAHGYGNNTMMSTSNFQEGHNSPAKNASGRVYASVAEMKRSKGKGWTRVRFNSPRVPGMGELRRDFHSTPDLFAIPSSMPLTHQYKGSRSQEDVNLIYSHTVSRTGGLPPPSHPPPPPPTSGQVVAVDIGAEGSEQPPPTTDLLNTQPDNIMSSFRPANNAKLYASPQDVNSVAFRSRTLPNKSHVRKSQSLRTGNGSPYQSQNLSNSDDPANQYAQPFKPHRSNSSASNKVAFINRQNSTNTAPPPIPEPDYSMSESEDENDNKQARSKDIPADVCTNINALHIVAETSANSNASGSSSGSGSMHHSFSVDEIQKIRTQLKSSKSYPNDFLLKNEENSLPNPEHPEDEGSNDDGDNSSSGVSSDQELTIGPHDNEPEKHRNAKLALDNRKYMHENQKLVNAEKIMYKEKSLKDSKLNETPPKNTKEKVSFNNNVMIKSSNNVITTEPVHLNSSSENITSPTNYQPKGCVVSHSGYNTTTYSMVSTPSGTIKVLNPLPPSNTLQRHNSLTRKQAASFMFKRDTKIGQSAAERLGVNVSKGASLVKKDVRTGQDPNTKGGVLTRSAVSLAQLPPPPEEGGELFAPPMSNFDIANNINNAEEVPPLAPPPQFSDRVRIVGALPKQGSRLHSQ
ncbi:SH3 and multiple ankyrin repeat domains prosap isoform X2 [Arctopsyche grandis]|uniref:SH3 and multiple ankyrin repeat domains prosap isoform X2 n=1 Tax=Arctopsyche grandis TaxID=121162 RepID=UPI00406D85C2